MKILMTLMGLEIGGAETHVVELSKELAARGHDITVASNGGVYVAELEHAGVRHVKLPLHSKSPSALAANLRGLRKLIKTERFDIVHAHARIPAFVCGILARRMKFRFITSTHGVYKVDSLLMRISDWGERAIAVSYDIKQYLIDSYNIPSDNISVTINGIDTNRFTRNIDCSAQRREFELGDDMFRIVYVSRIDTEAALTGFLLCDAAEKLLDSIPNLEILIVGAGTAFDELKKRADEVNSRVGRRVIKLTGARTDVAQLIATSDVFVGVSRAALEAMSEEKPVVLAGAQGYIGIFDDTVCELAESTNFCCRGQRLPTAELLINDIMRLHSLSQADREALGSYDRALILKKYSVARMTDDYICAYKHLAPYEHYKHGDVILSGYYGFENLGDDALLTSMIERIRELDPDIRITVLTNSPKETAEVCGVKTINRFNIAAIMSEMKHAKLLISGGGSLLQDGTSRKSLYYYVYIMRMAKRYGLKLMLYSNGLGPLRRESSKRMAADIMNRADHISLREEHSKLLAHELGIGDERLKVTADPAFMLNAAEDKWVEHISAREKISGKYFIVSVKEGNNFGESAESSNLGLVDKLADDIRDISKRYSLTPLFVPMHVDKDAEITDSLLNKVGFGKVISGLSAKELCGLISRSEFVIGMRLHILIFAASMKVPMIGISYDPKIDAFLDYIGLSRYCFDVRTLSPGQLSVAVNNIVSERSEICSGLSVRVERLRELALSDSAAVINLLKGII
ncbi:MAG: polysaccharide pyruvyl transferase CsaB [Clostridiales bacterium]|nr:polysaccharide pyruvyl transferase CsaB [Clostridiales bacterium]